MWSPLPCGRQEPGEGRSIMYSGQGMRCQTERPQGKRATTRVALTGWPTAFRHGNQECATWPGSLPYGGARGRVPFRRLPARGRYIELRVWWNATEMPDRTAGVPARFLLGDVGATPAAPVDKNCFRPCLLRGANDRGNLLRRFWQTNSSFLHVQNQCLAKGFDPLLIMARDLAMLPFAAVANKEMICRIQR